MDQKLSKRYQELSEELKELFKELAALQAENERLSQENITLREEVSLLRLYIDTYLQAGEDVSDLEEMDLLPPSASAPGAEAEGISQDALEFYESLPQSFNFSELFELADLLGVEKQRMKGFMTTYLRENLMKQHGTRVEKTGKAGEFWQRPLGKMEKGPEDAEKAKRDA